MVNVGTSEYFTASAEIRDIPVDGRSVESLLAP